MFYNERCSHLDYSVTLPWPSRYHYCRWIGYVTC